MVWDSHCEYIDFATFAYNNTENIATGFSPFELIFGKKSKLPSEIISKDVPLYNYDNYAMELRYKLKSMHDLARENLVEAKENNKKYYDKNNSVTLFCYINVCTTTLSMHFNTQESQKIVTLFLHLKFIASCCV